MSTIVPLLICAFRSRYLEHVLHWLQCGQVQENYLILVWDNGGAGETCRHYNVTCHALRDKTTDRPVNVGKALAMRFLVDVVQETLPDADCYVCMDPDIIVDRDHLDALVAAARRPGLGMIGARFHPFNSPTPTGGCPVAMDPCPRCGRKGCADCAGSGDDPHGLRLLTFPAAARTEEGTGKVAGGLFAVSRNALAKLSWAPYLYPILQRGKAQKPVLYWAEDALLDGRLTELGFVNGYLDMPTLTPAIHLPELNARYLSWKNDARVHPPTEDFDFGADADA